jgi:carboxymethylenebutenolidase
MMHLDRWMKLVPACLGSLVLVLVLASVTAAAQDSPNDGSATPGLLSDGGTKSTGRSITLSDFGAEDLGYLAIPATPPSIGIVLVPDAYGLDDFTKQEADRLAGQGYLVVAVDIYNGKQMNDPGLIANMVSNLDGPTVMKTVEAGVRLFHESPKFHVDHVVMVGWGVGANYVWQATSGPYAPDGAVMFYGPVQTSAVTKVPIPVCALYSDRDPTITRDSVLNFQHALRDQGSDFTAWFIAAAPGWSNPQSKAYSPGEDREAWKVAEPFILRIATLPVKKYGPSEIDKVKASVKNIWRQL